jgi:hypothetical protein
VNAFKALIFLAHLPCRGLLRSVQTICTPSVALLPPLSCGIYRAMLPSRFRSSLFFCLYGAWPFCFSAITANLYATPFSVSRPDPAFEPPPIVWWSGREDVSGVADLDGLLKKTSQVQNRYTQIDPAVEAVRYLREAVHRMTGRELRITGQRDAAKGIVLMLREDAPAEIREDPKVREALSDTVGDTYSAREAFYIRTEPERILIVANTVEGFNHAVVELLESAGYETLAMGPRWIHVPDYTLKPLIFDVERAGRPGYYVREIAPTSGQGHGIGTIFNWKLSDPADELVGISHNRWSIGARFVGRSMPQFRGHAMQKYHTKVYEAMKERGTDEGFMSPPGSEIVFREGKYYSKDEKVRSLKVDLSTPLVREILLADLKEKSEAHFASQGNAVFVFETEPEDGIIVEDVRKMRYPDWYPDQLKREGIAFGQPYALHGFKGLDQPHETWEPYGFSDTVFGFNNWLLREYDRWIDSLPAAERVTRDGTPKKRLIRATLYSYSVHDVPPNFNLDPRIRVMIAGFPKHRGWGKWKNFASHIDMARAFQVLLPHELLDS